ncbi:MAG TPA: 5-formyltetrahydrofolate cyclo-ligase [Phycisphaerae bacterium]|nr:5-formyltetrahydrofolate cyclo-ligase [Phycisphaerae bacterium]
MKKEEIRARMREVLAAISSQQRHERSLVICQKLSCTREYARAQLVLLFLSMEQEVETSTLAIQAWKDGKCIAVPRVLWDEKKLEPVEIKSLETTEHRSVAGLREPTHGTLVPLGRIDLIAVPGLAFDRRGYRIGRGKGFYDRFLAQREIRATRVALCFHEQLLHEHLTPEVHDVPVDIIVTDQQIIHCRQAAAMRFEIS